MKVHTMSNISQKLEEKLQRVSHLMLKSKRKKRLCSKLIRSKWKKLEEQRIERLKALRAELKRMVRECGGGNASQCRVLEVLRDHSECLTEHDQIGV